MASENTKILNKTILTDIDGVVLNWADSFFRWMGQRGYPMLAAEYGHYGLENLFGIDREDVRRLIEEFNSSAEIGFLSPMPDAVIWMRRLCDRGYNFRGVTSLGGTFHSQILRNQNLQREFPGVFQDCICLPLKAKKSETLSKLKDEFGLNVETIWIEDHVDNAKAGEDLGFKTIVYAHIHNVDWKGIRVQSWKEIYDCVLDMEWDGNV